MDRAIDEYIDRHPDLKADRDFLTSIPVIGAQAANAILSIVHNRRINSAEGLAAYLV